MKLTVSKILHIFYPNRCISCGRIIEYDNSLCEPCFEKLKVINPKKRCLKCGNDKNFCKCKTLVYRFESVISVFENDGSAKNILYRYKFGGRPHISDFLVQEMANAVKNEYKDIKFDIICPVPSSRKSRLKYGFDHTMTLSKKLSKNLGIESFNMLRVVKQNSQHKSKFSERMENVKGKYEPIKRADNKTVLLVDDIKTSGATLDECAKQLLFAGAERVYCVTALSTYPKKVEK